jgi:dimethylhistidine N-methyltransferase
LNARGNYAFYDFKPAEYDVADEVLAGLSATPKFISPKYFYDEVGSALFERITQLDEYYITRTEMALFDQHLGAIAEHLGDEVCLIEYGSGSSLKIRKVLEAITPLAYVPVDISLDHLLHNAKGLHADYPTLHVYPVCADITQPFDLPEEVQQLDKVGFFPGSSIGNFDPHAAVDFLANVRACVGAGGYLLAGVDRKKSKAVLEQAYNDEQGVTAAFNLNVLAHLNAVLNADFALDQFRHVARYNEAAGCIQMFLQSGADQSVRVAGQTVTFTQGELIHTENSYKYSEAEFIELAGRAGFRPVEVWSDSQAWFSLYLLRGE